MKLIIQGHLDNMKVLSLMRTFLLTLERTLASHHCYWRIRKWLLGLLFKFKGLVFRIKFYVTNLFFGISIFGIMSRAVLLPVLITALLGAMILFIAIIFSELPKEQASSLSSLTNVITIENYSTYDGVLIAIITVVGLFLTLYFTNINTIAGTIYVKLSTKLRSSFIRERVTNVYTNFLIFLLLLCLLILIYGTISSFRSNLIMLIIGVLSLFAIQAFVKLSERSYTFIDPTALIYSLLWEIDFWSQQATIKGYAWSENAFQDHFRRRAAEAIEGIRALVDLCHQESHLQTDALQNLVSTISGFIPTYLKKKHLIPSDSYWYQKKPKYNLWYLSPDFTVGIAAATRTDILPKMEPDPFWIESEVSQLLIRSFELCLKDGRKKTAISILDDLNTLVKSFGHEWLLELGVQIIDDVSRLVRQSIDGGLILEPPYSANDLSLYNEDLAIIDYLGLFPISLFLSFKKSVKSLNVDEISHSIKHADWKPSRRIHEYKLPISILPRLEYLGKCIKFEINAEGHQLTANWYLIQMIFQDIAFKLHESIERLERISDIYKLGNDLIEHKRSLLATTLLGRVQEYYQKKAHHLQAFIQVSEKLDSARVEMDIPWPLWNWEEVSQNISKKSIEVDISYLGCIPALSMFNSSSQLPDFLGRAVHLAGELTFQALASNDVDRLQKLIAIYFGGILLITNKLRESTLDWHVDKAAQAYIEPIIDLCSLSGYAFFWAEFHGNNQLWLECKAMWDKYFEGSGGYDRLKFISAAIAYNSRLFMITHRAVLRTQWEMQVSRILSRLNKNTLPKISHGIIPRFIKTVEHPSLLVRVMAGPFDLHFSIYDGVDIFVYLFLKDLPDSDKLDFGNINNIREAMDRREQDEQDDEDEIDE